MGQKVMSDDDFLSTNVIDDNFLDVPEVTTLAANTERRLAGRPSKWCFEMNEQVFNLCLLGATDKELAVAMNISESTLNEWKITKPGFSESMLSAKDEADAKVTKSLYQRALGYSHNETKIVTHMGLVTDKVDIEKHYAPDTRAIEYWLNNRQRGRWNNTVKTELTGKDGKPLQTMNANLDINNMSNIEKASRLVSIMQKAVKQKGDSDE